MANTHDMGRLFWALQSYDPKQTRYRLLERGDTAELEQPYRRAKPWVLMLPKIPRVLILGRWGEPTYDEDSVLPGMTVIGEHTDFVRRWQQP